jgi:hypothetical protein
MIAFPGLCKGEEYEKANKKFSLSNQEISTLPDIQYLPKTIHAPGPMSLQPFCLVAQ